MISAMQFYMGYFFYSTKQSYECNNWNRFMTWYNSALYNQTTTFQILAPVFLPASVSHILSVLESVYISALTVSQCLAQ